MAPTSQNQETTMAPVHNLRSTRKVEISVSVEASGLRVISRLGAAGPVGRMKSDETHEASEIASNAPATA